MSDYDDDLSEEVDAKETSIPTSEAPSSHCPRWMYHRPGVFCHVCEQVAGKTVKGVSLHLDLPPGGNVKSDWKKKKEKKQ